MMSRIWPPFWIQCTLTPESISCTHGHISPSRSHLVLFRCLSPSYFFLFRCHRYLIPIFRMYFLSVYILHGFPIYIIMYISYVFPMVSMYIVFLLLPTLRAMYSSSLTKSDKFTKFCSSLSHVYFLSYFVLCRYRMVQSIVYQFIIH